MQSADQITLIEFHVRRATMWGTIIIRSVVFSAHVPFRQWKHINTKKTGQNDRVDESGVKINMLIGGRDCVAVVTWKNGSCRVPGKLSDGEQATLKSGGRYS